MKKIGKSDAILHLFKELYKTNRHPSLVVTDDLEVLRIAYVHNLTIPYLLVTENKEFQEDTKELLNGLIQKAHEVYEITESTYQKFQLKENHAGILAAIKLPKYEKEDLKDFIVVLDHLELPGNIGTIYRTLDACEATGVLLVDPMTKLHNPKLTSSARGTNLLLPTICMTYEEAQSFLVQNGYTIYLGEPKLGQDYKSYSYAGKIAIVVGNERFGINENWYHHPHKKVFIPMNGSQNSLNVGVATSILAYEAYMKRKTR